MSNPSFTVSQNLKVKAPKESHAYVVSTIEWNYLKEKVSQVKGVSGFYHTVGSVLLGATASAVVAAISTDICLPSEESCTKDIVVWAFSAVTFICGLLSLHFGHAQKSLKSISLDAVIEQMEAIENRYVEHENQS